MMRSSPFATGGQGNAEGPSAERTSRYELRPGDRWYVAMTLPRKERMAAANLDNQDIRSFLPLQDVARRHAHKFKTELVPVFARYIFVILDVDRQRWRSVNGTLGVQSLITDGARPLAVAPGIVETFIQSSDLRGALIYKADNLAIGDQVKLVAGPFAGSLGILQRLDGIGRVQVLLELLGGAVRVSAGRHMVAASP
ncbi:MAG: transcription termination/antitermination protein NusG [Roseiarcus sp.]